MIPTMLLQQNHTSSNPLMLLPVATRPKPLLVRKLFAPTSLREVLARRQLRLLPARAPRLRRKPGTVARKPRAQLMAVKLRGQPTVRLVLRKTMQARKHQVQS
jgi:hypothetical protein